MIPTIRSYCGPNEVNNCVANVLKELKKSDWSTDPFLTKTIKETEEENKILTQSIGSIKDNPLAESLHEEDINRDQIFLALKKEISAKTYRLDPLISSNAKKLWRILEAHDLQLTKKSYERESALINSLITELENDNNKSIVDSLPDLKNLILDLKNAQGNFENVYLQMIEQLAGKEEIIAPTAQLKVVRDLFNKELVSYLNTMCKVSPDIFMDSAEVIKILVENINTKARSRKNRNKNKETVSEESNEADNETQE